MGARTIADFRDRQELSVTEGQYLLSFCNNLGPVYFLGFVLPLLHRESTCPIYSECMVFHLGTVSFCVIQYIAGKFRCTDNFHSVSRWNTCYAVVGSIG